MYHSDQWEHNSTNDVHSLNYNVVEINVYTRHKH